MPASFKYFILRSVNAIIVLFVVVFIISLTYSSMSDDILEGIIAEEVRAYAAGRPEGISDEAWNELVREYRMEREERHGLHDPLWERVVKRTWFTFIGDLGHTNTRAAYGATDGRVTTIILHYLPRTILLFTTASVISVSLGIMMGMKAAQLAGSKVDKFLSIFGIVTSSMPMWWVGMLVILIFAFGLGWFPASAYPFPSPDEGFSAYYGGILWRLVMPLGTIVFVSIGGRAWSTRNMVTSVLQDDYIMAARAKGVPERKVIYGHTLKTAAPPIITSAILSFLLSIGGAMITEVIFNWPGMGYLLRTAIFQEADLPVIMGIVYITTVLWVFGYLLADLLYGFLDPRVEVGAEKRV